MSSNYAVESVARSSDKFVFAPAPQGQVEGVSTVPTEVAALSVATATLVPLTNAIFDASGGTPSGVWLITAECANAAYSVSAVGSIGTGFCQGFNSSQVTTGAGFAQLTNTGGSVQLYQTSGGPLVYNVFGLKLASNE
jgi:hypothetical protein